MESVVDLLIEDGDLVFGADGEPVLISGAAAIAQDVKHRVIASGQAPALVAEDADPPTGAQRIAQIVEEDLRVRPGSALLTGPDAAGQVSIRATLMNGETVEA